MVASYTEAPENDKQIVVDLEWTLTQLLSVLKDLYGLEGTKECRLRNLFHARLYHKEEMETKLATYPDFVEGGARI